MRFYRSMEYTQFTSLFFALLFFNPLALLAMKTRQINVLKSPAEITRQKNPPWQLAGFMCDFSPPNLLARIRRHFNLRYLLAREPSFPAQNPQVRPGPPPSPPPPAPPHNGGGGRGQEADPACPCILNRYSYFHFPHMNGYIFLYDTTYTHSTQSGSMNERITILL